MAGLSEGEIRCIITDLGLGQMFLGTFDRTFPGFGRFLTRRRHNVTAIVNTGYREDGGQHWIAMSWNNNLRRLYVFDPLGWTDQQLLSYYDGFKYDTAIVGSMVNRCVTVVRNKSAVQCSCSGACGLYCVLFIYAFAKEPIDPDKNLVLNSMYGTPAAIHHRADVYEKLHANQVQLYRFFRENSKFYNAHRDVIESNTRLWLIKTH